jgi:hypothetical protein
MPANEMLKVIVKIRIIRTIESFFLVLLTKDFRREKRNEIFQMAMLGAKISHS